MNPGKPSASDAARRDVGIAIHIEMVVGSAAIELINSIMYVFLV